MSKSNTDQIKVYNSPVYRRRIKRMVEMAKTIRGIHTKVPRGGLPKLPGTATEKEKKKRAEAEAFRMNIESLHYFAAPITGFSTQGSSSQQSSTNSEHPATQA